jgi:hypothetical protein
LDEGTAGLIGNCKDNIFKEAVLSQINKFLLDMIQITLLKVIYDPNNSIIGKVLSK